MEKFVLESDCTSMCKQLNDMENWLYEDGMECNREAYIKKLTELTLLINPIKLRAEDYEKCPIAFNELKQVIAFGRNAVNEFKVGSPKYDHLTEVEFLNISEYCDRVQSWYDTNYQKFNQSARTSDSPVKSHEIYTEMNALNNCINSVINRPKPKTAPVTNSKPSGNRDINAMGDDQHQNGMNNDTKNDNTNQPSTQEDINMESDQGV